MSQGELFTAETSWFHVFNAMVKSGDVAAMGPHAVAVYLVIKAHTNFSTGRAFPAIETIVEKSGVSRAQVMRSLQTLEHLGYLSKEKAGRSNVYRLREKVEIRDGEGRPAAVATWDYLPSTVREAQAELRKFMMNGLADGKVVYIEHLNLNVQINHPGAHGTINNQTPSDKVINGE
jgi:hypothetical protein